MRGNERANGAVVKRSDQVTVKMLAPVAGLAGVLKFLLKAQRYKGLNRVRSSLPYPLHAFGTGTPLALARLWQMASGMARGGRGANGRRHEQTARAAEAMRHFVHLMYWTIIP
jgi:hypothetical protein